MLDGATVRKGSVVSFMNGGEPYTEAVVVRITALGATFYLDETRALRWIPYRDLNAPTVVRY